LSKIKSLEKGIQNLSFEKEALKIKWCTSYDDW